MRIAAVGDVHVGADSSPEGLRTKLAHVNDDADVLLVAGDLTKCGTPEEADRFVDELGEVTIPVVTVLGNHDHHAGRPDEVVGRLDSRGIRVLDGDDVVLPVAGYRLGIAGIKGFGGGFAGASATAFGEEEIKAFVRHSEDVAGRLLDALRRLEAHDCDRRVALMHYSPCADTLVGERLEIYPFLGSQHLAEAVDEGGADLAIHGHAHIGSERGRTPGGVPVRNVAMPVIHSAYRVFELAVPMPAGADGSAAAAGYRTPMTELTRLPRRPRRSGGRPLRRGVAALALVGFVGIGACGDDDDPEGPDTPATGANLTGEGNVDVTSSIADPDVVASNVGEIVPPANS